MQWLSCLLCSLLPKWRLWQQLLRRSRWNPSLCNWRAARARPWNAFLLLPTSWFHCFIKYMQDWVLPIVAGFLAVLGQEFMRPCVCLQRGLQPGAILAGKWGDESGLQQIKTQVWRQLGQAETARLRPLLQLVPMSAGSSLPLHVLFCKVVCWKVLLRIDVGKCCPARMMFSTVVHTEEGSGGCFSSTEDPGSVCFFAWAVAECCHWQSLYRRNLSLLQSELCSPSWLCLTKWHWEMDNPSTKGYRHAHNLYYILCFM